MLCPLICHEIMRCEIWFIALRLWLFSFDIFTSGSIVTSGLVKSYRSSLQCDSFGIFPTLNVMDEDMQVFIGEWLKDSQYDVLDKASASNPDIVEAIFSLIEEWKSNKEVICLKINSKIFVLLCFKFWFSFCSSSTSYAFVSLVTTEQNSSGLHCNSFLVWYTLI